MKGFLMLKSKVVVIGIDGTTWFIFDQLIQKGVLPNLKKLVENYFSTQLESTIPPVTAPAWSSFITGMNPDKHGIYDFARHQTGNYQTLINNANLMQGKSLWKILSEHDKTVGVINVPMTYPPEKVNGFIIPGFLSPGVSKQKILTSPLEIADELEAEIGGYKIYLEMSPKATIEAAGKDGFLKLCSEIVNKRFEAAAYLYQKKQPDFFMVHFLMTDVVQHWFWHCLDESHPAFNRTEAEALTPKLHDFFHNLDQKIGLLLDMLDSTTDVILLSDHGFGPLHTSVFLNRWLYENNFLKLNLKKQQTIKSIRKIIAAIDFLNLRNRVIPSGEKRVALEKSLQHDFLINWKKTSAFAAPASIYGSLFLNVENREAEGIVDSGTQFKNLASDLKNKLTTYTNSKNGDNVFDFVFSKEEIYPNDAQLLAPDLLIKPKDGYAVFSQLNESRIFKNITSWEEITGTHRVNGILIIKSEKFQKSKNRNLQARIIDLAPTILYVMGLPVPENMDGEVLEKFIKNSVLAENAPQYSTDANSAAAPKNSGYSQAEEDLIRQRLQDLGYLE